MAMGGQVKPTGGGQVAGDRPQAGAGDLVPGRAAVNLLMAAQVAALAQAAQARLGGGAGDVEQRRHLGGEDEPVLGGEGEQGTVGVGDLDGRGGP